jgi:hypothetical protein
VVPIPLPTRVDAIAHGDVLWYVQSPMPTPTRGPRSAVPLVIALIGFLALGCSASDRTSSWTGPTEDTLVAYERSWPDGLEERQLIEADGSVQMWHGDRFERLALPSEDLDRIVAALEDDIPVGAPEDSPARRLILADGTVVEHPRPVAGSVIELMDRLMETHSLG